MLLFNELNRVKLEENYRFFMNCKDWRAAAAAWHDDPFCDFSFNSRINGKSLSDAQKLLPPRAMSLCRYQCLALLEPYLATVRDAADLNQLQICMLLFKYSCLCVY